jgi:aminoglycoside 2'-N-acetyltransferase I
MTVVHTADLPATRRAEVKALLELVFAGRWEEPDWDHTLGGLHVLAYDADRIIAHAAVVQRRLLWHDRPVRTGYVEAVGVAQAWRGRGLAAAVMTEAERIVGSAYELGALSSAAPAAPFYLARGWRRWPGPTAVLGPDGLTRTPDDDGTTYVFDPAGALDLSGVLACDWRPGDVW